MIEDRSLGLNAPGESNVEQRYRSERGKDGRHFLLRGNEGIPVSNPLRSPVSLR